MKKKYRINLDEYIDKDKVYNLVAKCLMYKCSNAIKIGKTTGSADTSWWIDVGYQTIYHDGKSTYWKTFCENEQKYIFGDIDTMLDICGENNIALFADQHKLVRVSWIAADA